jgi:hypothetical protein
MVMSLRRRLPVERMAFYVDEFGGAAKCQSTNRGR